METRKVETMATRKAAKLEYRLGDLTGASRVHQTASPMVVARDDQSVGYSVTTMVDEKAE